MLFASQNFIRCCMHLKVYYAFKQAKQPVVYRMAQKVVHFQHTISLEPFTIKWKGFTKMFLEFLETKFRLFRFLCSVCWKMYNFLGHPVDTVPICGQSNRPHAGAVSVCHIMVKWFNSYAKTTLSGSYAIQTINRRRRPRRKWIDSNLDDCSDLGKTLLKCTTLAEDL